MEEAEMVSLEKRMEQKSETASYMYWVREATVDAAPRPVPKKLSQDDILSSQSRPPKLGSVWNKELVTSIGSLEFSGGKAEISKVSNCTGDAFLVTVRNKKRVVYNYVLTLRVKGEWMTKDQKKKVKGNIDIPEFSFGELEDLQMEVKLSEDKDLVQQDKLRIVDDLKLFLQPVREKLLQFEQELKDR